MTRPGIEPRSPGPLANTLTAGPMLKEVKRNKNKNKPSTIRGTDRRGKNRKEGRKQCNVLEEKKKKKKKRTRNKNKPATEKRKERKKNRKCK